MPPTPLTEQEQARLEELRDVASTLALILNPDPLKRLRRLQGLVYGEMDALGDGRKEAADLVDLGPKAIDWARNKARSTEGPEVEVLVEFHELLDPVRKRLESGTD